MADRTHRPVILISAMKPDTASAAAIMAMVRASGAEPMLISRHMDRVKGKDEKAIIEQAQADLAKADGVIVMGNDHDINPADYGEKTKHAKTNIETETPEGLARARYEYALIGAALAKKAPLLGVCAGMQRINVLLGGTLHQHVPDLLGSEEHDQEAANIPMYIPVEFVGVQPGTTLARIADGIPGVYTPTSEKLPPGVVMENSHHHQAVNKVGHGLRAAASSIEPTKPDVRVIEAIEADPNGPFAHQFVMATQWHPEFGASDLSVKLLNEMTQQAREYGKQRASQTAMEETVKSLGDDTLGKLSADPSRAVAQSWANRVRQPSPSAGITR